MSRYATIPAEYRERLDKLAAVFGEARLARRMSLRAVAEEVGVGFTILNRFELGMPLDLPSLLRVLEWLHLPLSWLSGDGDELVDAYRRGWDDCAATVRAAMEKPQRPTERP